MAKKKKSYISKTELDFFQTMNVAIFISVVKWTKAALSFLCLNPQKGTHFYISRSLFISSSLSLKKEDCGSSRIFFEKNPSTYKPWIFKNIWYNFFRPSRFYRNIFHYVFIVKSHGFMKKTFSTVHWPAIILTRFFKDIRIENCWVFFHSFLKVFPLQKPIIFWFFRRHFNIFPKSSYTKANLKIVDFFLCLPWQRSCFYFEKIELVTDRIDRKWWNFQGQSVKDCFLK